MTLQINYSLEVRLCFWVTLSLQIKFLQAKDGNGEIDFEELCYLEIVMSLPLWKSQGFSVVALGLFEHSLVEDEGVLREYYRA